MNLRTVRAAQRRLRDSMLLSVPAWSWWGVVLVFVVLLGFGTYFRLNDRDQSKPGLSVARLTAPLGILREEVAIVRGFALVRDPLPPPPPPAQSGVPPLAGLFSLPASDVGRRQAFKIATDALLGRNGAQIRSDGTRLPNLDRDNFDCATLADRTIAGTTLVKADAKPDTKPGMINYHLGIVDLCGRQLGPAKDLFTTARDAFKRIRESNRDPEYLRWLYQYEAAANYGVALAVARWPAHDALTDAEYQAADAALVAAKALTDKVPQAAQASFAGYGKAGAYKRFSATTDRHDLLDFSSADILSARLWLALRTPAVLDAAPQDLVDWTSAGLHELATLDHPALAANAAAFAIIAQRKPDGGNDKGFVGDPNGVINLHGIYASNSQIANSQIAIKQIESLAARERLRAMAAIAGSDFTRDPNAAAGSAASSYRTDFSAKFGEPSFPAFVLKPDGGKSAGSSTSPDPDAVSMDKYLYLRAMKEGVETGNVRRFADLFAALEKQNGWRANGFDAATGRLAAIFAPGLEKGAARLRAEGDRQSAAEIERVRANGGLYGGWGRIAAIGRLVLGNWWLLWLVLLIGLCVALPIWFAFTAGRLNRGAALLFSGRHHADRVPNATPFNWRRIR